MGFTTIQETVTNGIFMAFPPANSVDLGYYELSTHLLALEVMNRGYEVEWLRKAWFIADVGANEPLGFNQTRCNITSTLGYKCSSRKDYTQQLLGLAGLSVARSWVARPGRVPTTEGRVVVKPVSGGKGRGVVVGISDPADIALAVGEAGGPCLIEEFFEGAEIRFLTVGGVSVAAVGRQRPSVTGDGQSTVSELIQRKNASRLTNPHLRDRLIDLDSRRLATIREHGFEESDVLPAGKEIVIDRIASFSRGGDSRDTTESVHPSYHEIASRAQLALPGMGLSGVDLIARDFSMPAKPGNYIVCEVNSRPAIGSHHFPAVGTPRNVAKPIVDACLRHLQAGQRRRLTNSFPMIGNHLRNLVSRREK